MSIKSVASACCTPLQLWKRLWSTLSGSRQGVKDTIVSAAPQLVGVFTGFFGSVLVARGLGPEGLGQYALVMSLAGLAKGFSDLGVGQTAIRYASRAAANNDTPSQMSVLRWAFRWRLSLIFASTTVLFLLAPRLATLWHSEALIPYMRLGLLGGVFAAIASVPTIYFQSIKRFSTNASVMSAQSIISLAGILVISVFSLWSLGNVVLANLFASAIGALVFLAIVPKAALWPRNAMRKLKGLNLRRLLAGPTMQHDANNGLDSSSPAGFLKFHVLSTVIVMLTMRADIWMMGYFLEKSELGLYSVATRFTLPLMIAMGALNTALWPRASGITDPHQLMALLKRTLGLSVLLSFSVSIYAICAPFLAPLVFGADYEGSVLLGQVLCLRCCVSILIVPVGGIAYGFGFVRIIWAVNLVQLLAVITINLVLMPHIGALASAIALLANDVIGGVLAGLILMYVTREYRNVPCK